jgi:hypothetical protein
MLNELCICYKENLELERNLESIFSDSREVKWFAGDHSTSCCTACLSLGPVPRQGCLWALKFSSTSNSRNIYFGIGFSYFCCLYIVGLNMSHWFWVWGCTLYQNSFPSLMTGYFSLLLPDINTPCPVFCVDMWFTTLPLTFSLNALGRVLWAKTIDQAPYNSFDYFSVSGTWEV